MQAGQGLRRIYMAATAIGALLIASAVWATAAPPAPVTVSQKGRAFQPGQLTIKRGETVRIVNDDADLLHHAYIESSRFNFDSGEIAPGKSADVTFTSTGTFTVLCGIHPKMKLVVQVE